MTGCSFCGGNMKHYKNDGKSHYVCKDNAKQLFN